MKNLFLAVFFALLLFPGVAFATLGVGVGSGKIQVEDKLKPGTIYELPPLTVLNTGDEASDYGVSVSYHEQQPQLRPPEEWFVFSPKEFHLEPGGTQVVKITLNLPVKTQPGDYFAYLEGHPSNKAQAGNTTIGVAAAAKLYFTVVPATLLAGIYYKVISFWNLYSPWPQRAVALVGILLAIAFFKRFFHLQISRKG